MGQAEISELERLANQLQLVAPIKYDNPYRDPNILYSFVRSYGELFGISITERKSGFLDQRKIDAGNIKECFTNSNMGYGLRLVLGFCGVIGIIGSPFYPILGGIGGMDYKRDEIIIVDPTYGGIDNFLMRADKPHEYMHAYHRIVAVDLTRRGLLQHIEGFKDLPLIEPSGRVPTFQELKKFEKKFLNEMIKAEKRHS